MQCLFFQYHMEFLNVIKQQVLRRSLSFEKNIDIIVHQKKKYMNVKP